MEKIKRGYIFGILVIIVLLFLVPVVFAVPCDVVFVIDNSGSMYGDIPPTEIYDVKTAINKTVQDIDNSGTPYQVGGVEFYGVITNISNLTTNYSAFQNWINNLYSHPGSEKVFKALNESAQLDFRPNAKRIIFLFTDEGEDGDNYPPYYEDVESVFLEKEINFSAFLGILPINEFENIEKLTNATGGWFNYGNLTNSTFMHEKMNETLESSECYEQFVNQIQCHNSTDWTDCPNIIYGSNLTQVRANCTDVKGHIINATFRLEDVHDGVFFEANATSNEGDWWFYDNDDFLINLGEYKLSVTCFDNESLYSTDIVRWEVGTGIGECAELDTASMNYYLTQNIIPILEENCIIISAEDITLDCKGYWISNTTFNYSGVYSDQFNTTIKNCNISVSDSEEGEGHGIELVGANNSYIFNNTLNEQFRGLYLFSTNNSIIKDNIVNSNKGEGIYLISSSGNNLINNTVNLNVDGISATSQLNNS